MERGGGILWASRYVVYHKALAKAQKALSKK